MFKSYKMKSLWSLDDRWVSSIHRRATPVVIYPTLSQDLAVHVSCYLTSLEKGRYKPALVRHAEKPYVLTKTIKYITELLFSHRSKTFSFIPSTPLHVHIFCSNSR